MVAFHLDNGDMVPVLCQVQHYRVWCTSCLIFWILQNLHQLRLFPGIFYFPYNLHQGWLVQNLALLENLRKCNYTWKASPNSRTGINGLSCLLKQATENQSVLVQNLPYSRPYSLWFPICEFKIKLIFKNQYYKHIVILYDLYNYLPVFLEKLFMVNSVKIDW